MHVEIEDRHPLDTSRKRMGRCHRDAVDEAETHRRGLLRMMARRAHRAEHPIRLPVENIVHARNRGPSHELGGAKRAGRHRRIRVQAHETALRR